MKTFRTLDLAVEFYEHSQKIILNGELKSQLNRAAASIALNLSEGNAKSSARDKRYFFQMAYASLRECQTVFKLGKVNQGKILELSDSLGAHLYKLVNSKIKSSPNWQKRHSDI